MADERGGDCRNSISYAGAVAVTRAADAAV